MAQHSIVGPSGLSAIIQCPGKVRLSKGIPDKTAWVAFEGTTAHDICEKRLLNKPHYKLGAVVEHGEHSVTVDDEMLAATDVYVDFINGLRKKYKAEGLAYSETVEGKITLDAYALPEVWGTADYIMKVPFRVLYVIDYKHGQGVPVSPRKNAQAMAYGLGAGGENIDIYDAIHLIIIQPRGRGSEGAIKTWVTTPDELKTWAKDTLIPAVTAALGDDAPLNPGESQCRWCRAKAVCPAIAEQVFKTAQADFAEFSTFAPDDPQHLTIEQISEIFKKIKLISGFTKSIEEKVFNTLATGRKVPGYKLVLGRKRRSWGNEAGALKVLESVLGEAAYTKKPLSPAQGEKALGKDYKKQIAEFIHTDEGKPSIVPESDKKEAINLIADDFKNVK